ncbi:MAG TPA: amidohydrolase family protein [Acidobacteriota bacterium]
MAARPGRTIRQLSSNVAGWGFETVLSMLVFALALGLAFRTQGERSHPDRLARPEPWPGSGDGAHCSARVQFGFEVNRGQARDEVQFISRGNDYTLFLSPREVVLSLTETEPLSGVLATPTPAEPLPRAGATKTRSVIRMRLIGSNRGPDLEGIGPLEGKSHYLIGNEPDHWIRDVQRYAKVKYRQVYPGIDMVFHGTGGRLEFDFELAPAADPKAIGVEVIGAEELLLGPLGDLNLRAGSQSISIKAPTVFQKGDNENLIPGRFRITGKNRFGFDIGPYDVNKPLVIDPVLSFSTYLAGSAGATGLGIATDASGNIYVTGDASSADFPVRNPIQSAYGGSGDIFVAKFNPSGSELIYSTFIGGNSFDTPFDIAVDSSGNACITGTGKAHKSGVQFLAGTDFGVPYVVPGFSLHELALFVQAGFTPLEALQTATINPAKFLDQADSLGTVEKGKLADLVLLEANPLEDIHNTQKINAVVVNGRLIPKSELQAMLASVEAEANKK